MAGISLGNDFNAELVALAGWAPDAVDPSTVEVPFLNPGGPTTVRATASTNVDTAALNTLIQKYTPTTTPPEPVTDTTE
jgi:hypothetical protein